MVVTGRNKRLEELYHLNAERSEFYHMADLMKPPTLFTPDDHDKVGYQLEIIFASCGLLIIFMFGFADRSAHGTSKFLRARP